MTNEGVEGLSRDAIPGHNYLPAECPRTARTLQKYGEAVNRSAARLWHPRLRINRVMRVMLHERWSAEDWLVVRVEFRRALALRSEIRRAGWFD